MTLKSYPEMKDSGGEWFGPIPCHWKSGKIRAFARLESGHTPSRQHPEYWDDCTIPWFTLGDVWQIREGRTRYVFETKELVSEVGLANSSARLLPKGTVILSRTASVGFAAIMGVDMATTQDFANWVCGERLMPEFLLYALYGMKGEFERLMMGSTHQTIYMPDIAKLSTPLPPVSEQAAIIAFLVRETAKIDALVAEQERLIALLAEKRRAVISHAVTKGLDPNAPMKDSGVPWLGDVPAHWRTGKVNYFARLESGHTPSRQHPEYWLDCTIPWFTLGDVWQIREGKVRYVFETKELISEVGLANSSARLLPRGTVILSRTASVGFSAIMGVDMATTQDFANWACSPSLIPEFLLFVLGVMDGEFDRLMMGSTHQTIYMPDIAKLMMALPQVEEQEIIVEYLDRETAKLDILTVEAERGITLLKERRGALISAAVTGKIDVREAVSAAEVAA